MTGPDDPVGRIRSRSGALPGLVKHWDEITAEQRAKAVRLVPESGADLEDTIGRELWRCYQAQIRGLG